MSSREHKWSLGRSRGHRPDNPVHLTVTNQRNGQPSRLEAIREGDWTDSPLSHIHRRRNLRWSNLAPSGHQTTDEQKERKRRNLRWRTYRATLRPNDLGRRRLLRKRQNEKVDFASDMADGHSCQLRVARIYLAMASTCFTKFSADLLFLTFTK